MDLRASPFLFKLLSATVLLGGGLIGVQACKPRAASRIASNPAQQAETKDEKVATLPDPAAPGDNNPPAGTRSFFDQVMTVDGKVVEEWQATDLLWMMTQMGFGTLMGYSIAAGLLHKSTAIPARIA